MTRKRAPAKAFLLYPRDAAGRSVRPGKENPKDGCSWCRHPDDLPSASREAHALALMAAELDDSVDPFARDLVAEIRSNPGRPWAYLRDGLREYVRALARMPGRKRNEARDAAVARVRRRLEIARSRARRVGPKGELLA